MSARILIIDDDAVYANALARQLTRAGHQVTTLASAGEARAHAHGLGPQVIVLAQPVLAGEGLAWLEELRAGAGREVEVVVVSSAYDADFSVAALRQGAFDCLAKRTELEEGVLRIERALGHVQLRHRLSAAQDERRELGGGLLRAPALEAASASGSRVAPSARGSVSASLGTIRERHAEHERGKLVEALELAGGNVSRAARHVGLSRYQLLRRLAKYGLR